MYNVPLTTSGLNVVSGYSYEPTFANPFTGKIYAINMQCPDVWIKTKDQGFTPEVAMNWYNFYSLLLPSF